MEARPFLLRGGTGIQGHERKFVPLDSRIRETMEPSAGRYGYENRTSGKNSHGGGHEFPLLVNVPRAKKRETTK